MSGNQHTFEILPRPAERGGGFLLRLLENGVEVRADVFPLPAEDVTNDPDLASWIARGDAQFEAEEWIRTRRA